MSTTQNQVQIQKLIDRQISLPSPPAIVLQILDAVRKEDTCLQKLAQIISADPALTTKLLRVANSGIYSLANEVTSVDRALCVLGTNVIKNIVLSFVIAGNLRGSSNISFDFDYHWRRSVTAAVAAELLSNLIQQNGENIFVTSLLQDIGVLIMFLCKGDEYSGLLEERMTTGVTLRVLEEKKYGFNHQQLGATLLRSWGLPAAIAEPIRYHHDPSDAPKEYQQTAGILRIANQLSAIYTEANSAEKVRLVQADIRSHFGLGDEQIRTLVDDVATRSIEFLESFELDPGDIKPYSQMLQEANEALGELNLSYEQLVMELKEAKDQSEILANELHDANARLKELVFRDGLTGLYNHRYFQEVLSRELARALRYQSSLSLLMFDIDCFKTVNDSHGHPAGDLVLMNIAKVIQGAIRPSDIVARYGGEEFAVILPVTNQAGMKVFAERLRRSVEGIATRTEGMEIKVTISVGGACWSPDRPQVTREDLIQTADRALYLSKDNGRNQVTILTPKDGH